jgi:hypothetical protein
MLVESQADEISCFLNRVIVGSFAWTKKHNTAGGVNSLPYDAEYDTAAVEVLLAKLGTGNLGIRARGSFQA